MKEEEREFIINIYINIYMKSFSFATLAQKTGVTVNDRITGWFITLERK